MCKNARFQYNFVAKVQLRLKDRYEISNQKNFHYTRGITPKRVTSGGVHLHGLAPGLHGSEETSQWWRAVSDTVSI